MAGFYRGIGRDEIANELEQRAVISLTVRYNFYPFSQSMTLSNMCAEMKYL